MPTMATEEGQATGRAQGTLLPNSHYSETTIKGDMETVTDDCLPDTACLADNSNSSTQCLALRDLSIFSTIKPSI